MDKYQWVFVGGIPKPLEDLATDGKIEVHRGSDLLNYPRELSQKNLDVVVAPLIDNIFNRCKSNIKFLEMSALGIPCICQDLIPYSPYTDLLFKTADDLQDKIDSVLRYKKRYLKLVKEKRRIIDYGDHNSPNGWWLEKNLGLWMQQFMIPQKTLCYDIRKNVGAEAEAKAEEQKQEVIFNRSTS